MQQRLIPHITGETVWVPKLFKAKMLTPVLRHTVETCWKSRFCFGYMHLSEYPDCNQKQMSFYLFNIDRLSCYGSQGLEPFPAA